MMNGFVAFQRPSRELGRERSSSTSLTKPLAAEEQFTTLKRSLQHLPTQIIILRTRTVPG